MQAILLGGVIAEMANWRTTLQIQSFTTGYQSLGFALPFVVGIWLLFVSNTFFVATNVENSKNIVVTIFRNAIIYSFGVCVVHATLVTAYGLGYQMYSALYDNISVNPNWFWFSYAIPSVAIYAFVLPLILFLSGLMTAAIKQRYLRVGASRTDFNNNIALINLLLMFAFWNGVFSPILAFLGFTSPGFYVGFGTAIWIGVLGLITIFANSLHKKRIKIKCSSCKSEFILPGDKASCPNCNRMICDWAFIRQDIVNKPL